MNNYDIKIKSLRFVGRCPACLAPKWTEMARCVCTVKQNMYKTYIPLTARFPFSDTSNLLVAGMRRTSNWTEPERNRKFKKEKTENPMNIGLEVKQLLSPSQSKMWPHHGAQTPCCSSLTCLWQDGGPMDGDIFKGYRGVFHDNPQISHQGTPGQHQVTRRWVEDTPIDAVSNQVKVWRLWVYVCCWSRRFGHRAHQEVICNGKALFNIFTGYDTRGWNCFSTQIYILTDVIDSGRIRSSWARGKILCLGHIPSLGMVPLHQGGDQRGTNWYRVLHFWIELVSIHVDAEEVH